MPNKYESGIDVITAPYLAQKLHCVIVLLDELEAWQASWWGQWLKNRCQWANVNNENDSLD